MDIISTITSGINTVFTGVGAIVIGIVLGFLIAGLIGIIIYGIIKIRDRNKYK
jgi:hypothetical protein